MEGGVLRESPGGCAPLHMGAMGGTKDLFARADRLCVWRQSDNDIIVSLLALAATATMPTSVLGLCLLRCPHLSLC